VLTHDLNTGIRRSLPMSSTRTSRPTFRG